LNKRGEVAAHGSGSKNHIAPQQAAAWTVMGDTPNDGPLTCSSKASAASRRASRRPSNSLGSRRFAGGAHRGR
jgi:hypothetical protein